MAEIRKYNEMFDYLSAPDAPSEAHGNFVFGRTDPRLAETMARMYESNLARYFLITGGVGKDSGVLAEHGTPEAEFIGEVAAHQHRIPRGIVHLETEARNGGENVRNGLSLLQAMELPVSRLTVIAHATSLKRLSAMLEFEGPKNGHNIQQVFRVPTEYSFDPTSVSDQQEARGEILRIADWPAKGWLGPQPDLPADLVDFAREAKE